MSLREDEEILVMGLNASAVCCSAAAAATHNSSGTHTGAHTQAMNYTYSFAKTLDSRMSPKGQKKKHTASN